MTEPRTDPQVIQWDLIGLFSILVNKWWVVVVVFLAAIAVAFALSAVQDNPEPVYEATTKVLVVAPISDRVLGQADQGDGTTSTPGLSIDTIHSLATAKDLYQGIIDNLELTDAGGGPTSVETLAGLISSSVSTADEDGTLPLVTTTVQGNDPETVGSIARLWAEAFAEKNGEIVALEAAGSYELAIGAYEIGLANLDSEQDELLGYRQTRADERLSTLLTRGTERIQLEAERDVQRQAIPNAASLQLLEIENDVSRTSYRAALTSLDAKRSEIVGARSDMDSSVEELSLLEPVILLDRRISNESLITFLSNEPTLEDLAALEDLVFVEEEKNELYYQVRERAIRETTLVARLEEEISTLASSVSTLGTEIEARSASIDSTRTTLAEFDDDTGFQLSHFDDETASFAAEFKVETDLNVAQRLQEIEVLDTEVVRLLDVRSAAEEARSEGAGTIRLVEAAITPSAPIPHSGPRPLSHLLVIAFASGLFLGPLIALGYHAFQLALARSNFRSLRK